MDVVVTKPMFWYERAEAVFKGQIVASAKYDPAHSIRMSTDIEDFPFRVIMERNIVSINGKLHDFIEVKAETKIVMGSRGDSYKVTIQGKSRTCTCPGFKFKGRCKHTEV